MGSSNAFQRNNTRCILIKVLHLVKLHYGDDVENTGLCYFSSDENTKVSQIAGINSSVILDNMM